MFYLYLLIYFINQFKKDQKGVGFMFMTENFKSVKPEDGFYTYARAGVLSSVKVAREEIQQFEYDAGIDSENKAITLSAANTGAGSVYLLADTFGCMGGNKNEVDCNLFFMDGGVMIELLSGVLFLKAKNGQVYSVNEKGVIDYPSHSVVSDLKWVRSSDLLSNAKVVVKAKYNLKLEEDISLYTWNFVINTQFEVMLAENELSTLRTRFSSFYSDISLGLVSFEVKQEEVKAKPVYTEPEPEEGLSEIEDDDDELLEDGDPFLVEEFESGQQY